MANFTRVWPGPGLVFNAPPGSANLNQLDIDHTKTINATDGSTHAPTGVITIGGSGLDVTGPFSASSVSAMSVTGSLNILLGATLQLVGNQVVNGGAIVGIQAGAFLTVSGGGTFTMNAGSTANIAATTTLSGPTTVSGTLACSNTFTIVGASGIQLSPGRTYVRTCGGAIRYDTSIWQPPAALAAAPVTLTQAVAVTPGVYAEMAEYRADVPHDSTFFSITVRVKGFSLLGGLPAQLPTVRVIRTDTTTGAVVVLATVTDATAILADYKLDHDIVVPLVVLTDRTKYEYLVYVEGDSGSAGTFGTEVSSPRMTYVRGIIGEE